LLEESKVKKLLWFALANMLLVASGGNSDGNHPPTILQTTMSPTDPIGPGDLATLCVTAQDEESGGYIRYQWQQTSGPPLFAGPYPVTTYWERHAPTADPRDGSDMPFTECVYVEPNRSGTYEVTVTAFDWVLNESYDWVTTEDWLASQGDPNPSSRTLHTFTFDVTGPANTASTNPPQRFEIKQNGQKLGIVNAISVEGSALQFTYDYGGFIGPPSCPLFFGHQRLGTEPASFGSYNGHICDPDILPAPQSNRTMMYLARATSCEHDDTSPCPVEARLPGIVTVLDQPNDGSGGQATVTYAGLDDESYISRRDDQSDSFTYGPDSMAVNWSWSSTDSDGVALEAVPWDSCVTVSADFVSGIDSWEFISDDTRAGSSPIALDMDAPIEICPLRWNDILPPALPGDANSDGRVDGTDFLIWQRNTDTTTGATLAQGDFDADGDVDGDDLVIWQQHFGGTTFAEVLRATGVMSDLQADFDGDDDVDGDDFLTWQVSFGIGDSSVDDGGDVTDGEDFLIWQNEFSSLSIGNESGTIPEPATIVIAFILFAVASVGRAERGLFR
jgi:dockerin type I repeat protein